jgi:hypothetical protein
VLRAHDGIVSKSIFTWSGCGSCTLTESESFPQDDERLSSSPADASLALHASLDDLRVAMEWWAALTSLHHHMRISPSGTASAANDSRARVLMHRLARWSVPLDASRGILAVTFDPRVACVCSVVCSTCGTCEQVLSRVP